MAKSKVVQIGNVAVTPITRKQHEKLAENVRNRHEHLPSTPLTTTMRGSPEMSRWHSPEVSVAPRSDSTERELRTVGGRDDQEPESELRALEVSTSEPRTRYQDRGRTYRLRASEIQTMTDLGKFRALAAKDIEAFLYGGDKTRMEADLSNLRRQRLILERDVPQRENAPHWQDELLHVSIC